MEKSKICILLAVKEEENLKRALQSVIKQSIGFEKHISLLVADTVCSDYTREYLQGLKNRYKSNMEVTELSGASSGDAYNVLLKSANAEYICFMRSDGYYSENAFSRVISAFENNNTAAVSLKPVFINALGNAVQYAASPVSVSSGIYCMNLLEDSKSIQLNLHAYFFKYKYIKTMSFNTALYDDCIYDFLLSFQIKYSSYCYITDAAYTYTVGMEDDTSANFMQYKEWWYKPSVEQFLIPFAQKYCGDNNMPPEFIQNSLFYLLFAKYNCNIYERNKRVLNREQAFDFHTAACKLLKYIDNDIILSVNKKCSYRVPRTLRVLLLNGKAECLNEEPVLCENGEYFMTRFKNKPEQSIEKISKISKIKNEHIIVNVINYIDGKLEIDGAVSLSDFLPEEQINVIARAHYADGTSKLIDIEKTGLYPLIKCFGITYARKYPVHISVPVNENGGELTLDFLLILNGREYKLKVRFQSVHSKLTNGSKRCYWSFGDKKVLRLEGSSLRVENMSGFAHFKREAAFMLSKLFYSKDKLWSCKLLFLRTLYWLFKPFFKNQRIWITFDKLYKGGDNGEYFYKYCLNKKDKPKNIKLYYMVRDTAPDYKRLKKEKAKYVLKFNSIKGRLLSLYSEAILATHANIITYCGFHKSIQPYFKDLFNPKVICIQHGLTIQKIAQFQNRIFDNIRYYCCASKYEITNIEQPFYDFKPSQLKLTGLARYDGLKSNDQKQILITPTWRRNIVNSSIAHEKKSHNNYFKNSDYFKIYNSLINDKTLIDCAKKHGYKIIYLLHPAMSAQLNDFDRNDYVEIIPAAGDMSYEKILTESSLMVTDYSGVQFDFAYMRKPLVYYHPSLLPPHYDEGGLIYETMGFGPICTNHEEIVSTLCRYIENSCKTEEMYVKRSDDFFAFSDHNSCERIYNAVIDYLASGK